MLKSRHIHIFEVASILLFSILANYLFEVKIEFKSDIDWYRIAKIIFLTIGSFSLYLSVYALRKIEAQSEKNYRHEQDPLRRAEGFDTFFAENLSKSRTSIILKISIACVCIILFFMFEPILLTIL